MPDPASIQTLRAAVDTITPASGDFPGAVALGADRHVIDMLELGLPGITDMFAALLDAYAGEVRPGAAFAALDTDDRDVVLRAMSTDESQDIRDAVDALIVFGNGATFSEWSGYDRATGELKAPPTWASVGFRGPVHGHPDYREE